MFNFKHTAVLYDIYNLAKTTPEVVDWIKQLGIKTFLEDCRRNDAEAILIAEEEFESEEDVYEYNYFYGTDYTREEIVANYKKNIMLLPHADYDNFDELVRSLRRVHYDNPDMFDDFTKKPYAEIHNALMCKYYEEKNNTLN